MFGNCGFDNTEISAAYSVSTLTLVWYFVMVTQHAIVLSCCSVYQHPWGVSGTALDCGPLSRRVRWGEFWHGDPHWVEAEEPKSGFQIGIVSPSTPLLLHIYKSFILNGMVHLMQLFLLFFRVIANGVKGGIDSRPTAQGRPTTILVGLMPD